MTQNKLPRQAPPRSLKRVSILLIFPILFGALTAVLLFYYEAAWLDLLEGIEARKTLIVMDELVNHAIFLIIGLIAGIAFSGFELVAIDILGCDKKNVSNRFQKLCASAIIASVTLTFIGGFLINPFWQSKLEMAGYTKCQNNLFLLNKSLGNSAWVRNENWCYDEELSEIIRKHHNRAGFDKAAKHLKDKYLGSIQ